jgi:hypothetical protein
MESKDVEVMLRDLEDITRELDDVQREITRDIASKISSIQRMLEGMPDGSFGPATNPREIILEKARVILRENGETRFEGLY